MKSKYKLIIVDLYGVMTRGSYWNVTRWLAHKYNRPADAIYAVLYHKYFNQAALGKISERQFFERTIKELGFKEPWRKLRKMHLSFQVLNRSVFRFVLGLQKQGYAILLLSKNIPSHYQDTMKKTRLNRYFRHIVNTFDLGLAKASPETVQWVLKKFRVKPQETIVIDDQDFNLVAAKKMGAKVIEYKNFAQFKHKLTKALQ
ncbi:MAG: HAD-IA family hydrolase [Candidatus Doudnabacteria bacterium]|nr:HAD-IA family hydrolase [Candidatus Doudnabacteria bacterium]